MAQNESREEDVYDYDQLEYYLKVRDYKNRWLSLTDDIDQYEADRIVQNILRFNKHDDDMSIPVDKRTPIILFISSLGGDVDPGLELVDTIMNSITPVYTVNMGCQYSMGCIVGISGHKRFANKHAKYLIHDGSFGSFELGASRMKDFMNFNDEIEDRVEKLITSRTKITSEEYQAKSRVEWYMFADEAKRLGIVDYIIGTDCDINLKLFEESEDE